MGWLHRSPVVPSTTGEAGAEPAVDAAGPVVHDSPALAEIFNSIDPDQPVKVLDLGPALPVNLTAYSEIAESVRIAHLLRDDDLITLHDPESTAFVSLLERLSPGGEDTFELILAWDLLDYLVDDQPRILAQHLASVAAPGARIHAMITTADTMPSRPSRFEIFEAGRLTYRPVTTHRTAAPNPPPAMVERWLDPFRITRSVLLRHGVREFIGVIDRSL